MVDELPNSDDPSRSLYDPEETSEEDLWFLPGDPEDRAPTDLPLPSSKRRLRIERDEWIAAEGELGRNLADAASSLGRLDERFRHTPAAQRRLAISTAILVAMPQITTVLSILISLESQPGGMSSRICRGAGWRLWTACRTFGLIRLLGQGPPSTCGEWPGFQNRAR